MQRVPDQPKGALGRGARRHRSSSIPRRSKKSRRAEFDENGRLLNPDECIGEIVNKNIGAGFEGYYNNDEANAQRMRNGWYWSGDLGYRDEDGWFYFAGRDFEWLRVDGENFSAAPIERIIARYPGVILDAVYAVPDEEVGDQVMAALQVHDARAFDPAAFDAFLPTRATSAPSGHLATCASRTELPLTADLEGHQAPTAGTALGVRRPGLLPPLEGRAAAPAHTADDRRRIRAEFAARDRLGELDKI